MYIIYMYILYASQNGNAEQVAKEIYDEINNKTVDIYSLDESLSIFKTKHFDRPFCMVISTTGNGEIPLSGEKWWKFIKNRTIDKNYLSNMHFCILAIGDSNYNNFCGAGKKVYRRLTELQAIPMNNTIYIDDVNGDYDEKIQQFLDVTTTYINLNDKH